MGARQLIGALVCLTLLVFAPVPRYIPSTEKPLLNAAEQTVARSHPQEFKDLNFDRIRKIVCWNDKQKGAAAGTAWVIRKDTMVTAAHVVDQHCKDSATQKEVIPYYVDWDNDFALVYFNTGELKDVIEITEKSCRGFIKDERYTAVGFAGGQRLRETRLIAYGQNTDQNSSMRLSPTETAPAIHVGALKGAIYRGMSGGPVFDEEGIPVGINSMTNDENIGYSRELKDTILCSSNPRRNTEDKRAPPFAYVPTARVQL